VLNAACYSWQPRDIGPREAIEELAPARVRLSRTDGTSIVMAAPVFWQDSIFGSPDDDSAGAGMLAVPVSDVTQVELSELHGLRTLGAIVLVPVGLVLSLLAGCSITGGCGP
jgi:hypothetical protein